MSSSISLTALTSENLHQEGLFCLKNPKHAGFTCKADWLRDRFAEGLRFLLAKDEAGQTVGFIEYLPGEFAWRPVKADAYLFIHCLWVYPKKAQGKGFGTALIEACIADAREQGKAGVAVMCSEGSWMVEPGIFLRNGFQRLDRRGRFELLVRKLDVEAADPRLLDWTAKQATYKGWHLIYADQCPLHEKSVTDLLEEAREQGINLQVKKLNTAREAQQSPSGFGVYTLIHDGQVLEDHYISRTRFRNILRQTLQR